MRSIAGAIIIVAAALFLIASGLVRDGDASGFYGIAGVALMLFGIFMVVVDFKTTPRD